MRIGLQEYEVGRGDPVGNQLLVGLHHCLVEVGAAEIAAVHEHELVAEGLPGRVGAADVALELEHGGLGRDVHELRRHSGAEEVLYPEFSGLRFLEHEELASAAGEREADFGTGDGHSREFFDDVLELHVVGLEELAPCGGVEEKIAHGEAGACGCGHGGGAHLAVAADSHLGGGLVGRPPRPEGDFRHRGDACKRLAPEAVGHDLLQVFGAGDLGRGVPLEAEHRVRGAHAAAVVYHLYQGAPGVGHYHRDLVGACVDRVFKQFLDHGGGSLDDLPGGYHVGYLRRKNLEPAHPKAESRTSR